MGISKVLQGCHKGLTRVYNGYYEGVSRVLHGIYKGNTRVFHWCFNKVTRVTLGYYKCVNWVSQGCYMGVSIVLQEWLVKSFSSRMKCQEWLDATSYDQLRITNKIWYLIPTCLDLQILARKLLPVATIERLAIFTQTMGIFKILILL